MDPILLEIVNLEEAKETKCEATIFPADPSKGKQHYTLSKYVYIENEDFLEEHNPKSYGLTPEQPVCLKYGPVIQFVSLEKNADGSIDRVKVKILPGFDNSDKKVKGFLHWVSKDHSVSATCNLYAPHFLVDDIKKEMKKCGEKAEKETNPAKAAKIKEEWLLFVNPESLITRNNAKIWNLHKNIQIDARFQFERVGYFVLTEEANPKKGKYVFNRVVELKESKLKEPKDVLQKKK